MATGYSTKTLTQKLDIKQGHVVILLHAPEEYGHQLFPIPADCSIYDELIEPADIIQFFTHDQDELKKEFPKLKAKLKQTGSLWISWPKKTVKSKVSAQSNLNENMIREIGLENGLVDVKVIAVDEIWSGLKFVYRITDRSA